MKNKILCFLIMSITWFVGYVAYHTLLDIFLEILNFMLRQDFYNTKKFASFRTCQLLIWLNPFCILCAYKFTLTKSIRVSMGVSFVVTLIFLGIYIAWNIFNGFNPSHKVFFFVLVFLMTLATYFKIYFIQQERLVEFATLSVCEFAFISIVFIFQLFSKI